MKEAHAGMCLPDGRAGALQSRVLHFHGFSLSVMPRRRFVGSGSAKDKQILYNGKLNASRDLH